MENGPLEDWSLCQGARGAEQMAFQETEGGHLPGSPGEVAASECTSRPSVRLKERAGGQASARSAGQGTGEAQGRPHWVVDTGCAGGQNRHPHVPDAPGGVGTALILECAL